MRAPEPEALREMSHSAIRSALETGRMKWEARNLSKAEKTAIAEYLGKSDVAMSAKLTGVCPRDLDPPAHPPIWAGWGVDLRNTRFQPAAGLGREQIKTLKLKWAFGFPGAAASYGQPTSFAGMVFVGSEDGTVYALDAATGCSWWTFRASATVKTAISVGNNGHTAFFGDTNGYVYGVSVSDGSLVWRVHPDSHSAARITGSPLLLGTTLYVPISSGEEGAAADPHYPCCTFRGSLVALDTVSGKQIWRSFAIDETPKPTRQGPQGVQYSGPSGAAIWSPPKLWHRQLMPQDVWNSGCVAEQKDNCPESHGEDFDFGAPPILKTLSDGRDVLLLAQKSGVVYALDPDRRGRLLWQNRIGHGGLLGGIQ